MSACDSGDGLNHVDLPAPLSPTGDELTGVDVETELIAYDNVIYRMKPEAWNMHTVLGISTVLGVIGVVSAFGLFYLGERVFHLDRATSKR